MKIPGISKINFSGAKKAVVDFVKDAPKQISGLAKDTFGLAKNNRKETAVIAGATVLTTSLLVAVAKLLKKSMSHSSKSE